MHNFDVNYLFLTSDKDATGNARVETRRKRSKHELLANFDRFGACDVEQIYHPCRLGADKHMFVRMQLVETPANRSTGLHRHTGIRR